MKNPQEIIIEVVLVVACPSHNNPSTHQFVVVEQEDMYSLPSSSVCEDETTLMVASRVLKQHTGLDARIFGVGWVDLVQTPIIDNADRHKHGKRVVLVPYGCVIPEPVNLAEGSQWKNLIDLPNQMADGHEELLCVTCRHI